MIAPTLLLSFLAAFVAPAHSKKFAHDQRDGVRQPPSQQAHVEGTLVVHEATKEAMASAPLLPASIRDGGALALTHLVSLRSTQPGPPLLLDLYARAGNGALELRAIVHDRVHHNAQVDASIWDGDALQLFLHPVRPDEEPDEVKGEALAPGDLDIALGLGRRGPQAMMLRRGANEKGGPFVAASSVERDERRGTTTYAIEVPWSLMHTSRETIASIGIGVQLNDSDGRGAQRHLVWGVSRAGGLRPSELRFVRIATPPFDAPQMHLRRSTSFADFDVPAELDIVVPPAAMGRNDFRLEVQCHDLARTWPLTSHAGQPTRATLKLAFTAPFLQDRRVAPASRAKHGCTISLRDMKKPAGHIIKGASLHLIDGGKELREVERRLFALPLEGHERIAPLAVQHVRHAKILWRLVRADAMAAADTQPQLTYDLTTLAQTLQHTLSIVEQQGLPALDRALSNGTLPLLELLRSSVDGSWQPFVVQLPSKQPQNEPRPAVLFLHGKGSPSMARFLAKVLAGETRPDSGFVSIVPWARGNASVIGAAETDVFDIIDGLVRSKRIDRERIYLLGFSMGATGALNLALHSPGTFAAIGLVSGGSWEVSLGHNLGENVRGTPFYVWHGLKDSVVPAQESKRVVSELEAAHVAFEAHFATSLGHIFLPEVHDDILKFFAKHRRTEESHWRYTADGPHHRGRSGIYMHYDASKNPFPSVSLAIDAENNCLSLTTQGTDGLEVNLGHYFPEPERIVELKLNQVVTYRGPPVHLTLGMGAPRP